MEPGVSQQIESIGDVVRLAVAPVFLLSGVGVVLTMLTSRLARVVDRARGLERAESRTLEADMQELRGILQTLALRSRLLYYAIALCTISALLVATVVVSLFLGALLNLNLSLLIAVLFIVAMLSIIGGLLFFLREVFVGTRTLRIGLRDGRLG